jgi:VIT1/CCC1 family predicted Fe2+/Mn2+ transporter
MGANDGLVSTAALMLGIAAAENENTTNGRYQMVLAGLAGLCAGAFSMAVGEYVSVHSQRDSELADIEREKREFLKSPQAREREQRELAKIYESRGLSADLASQVAAELHLKSLDFIVRVHARDELGIDTEALANPMQAAVMSAITFSVGAGIPLLSSSFIESYIWRIIAIVISSTFTLLIIGSAGAKIGGAPVLRAAARVLLGGYLAMAATFGVGKAFGVSTG